MCNVSSSAPTVGGIGARDLSARYFDNVQLPREKWGLGKSFSGIPIVLDYDFKYKKGVKGS
jgi:hypothetical protein